MREKSRAPWVVKLWIGAGITIISVLILALAAPGAPIVRNLPVWRPYSIPSDSMYPTLRIGELFFANVNYYRGHDPDYGDLALYVLQDRSTVLVRRVAGKPGDRIQMIKGVLHINGQPVKHEFIGKDKHTADQLEVEGSKFKETAPNGASYNVLDMQANAQGDDTQEYVVPGGAYFVLGDNLDNSADSRFAISDYGGFVQRDQFFGRAAYIFYSPEPGRIGMSPDAEAAGAQ